MDKETAIRLFGSQASMARYLGVTRQAINNWPPKLNRRQVHEVVGAAFLVGKIKALGEIPGLRLSDSPEIHTTG